MTDEQRLELYEVLKERIGARPANTLMAAIPPVGWADVATKRDLDVLGATLRQEMAATGAGLRHDMELLRAELRQEITVGAADLRTEFHREGGLLRGSMADMQRTLFFSLLGAQATLAGLLAGLILAVR